MRYLCIFYAFHCVIPPFLRLFIALFQELKAKFVWYLLFQVLAKKEATGENVYLNITQSVQQQAVLESPWREI